MQRPVPGLCPACLGDRTVLPHGWQLADDPTCKRKGATPFAAHAACGTLQRTAGEARHGAGLSADVFKLLERGLSYSGALQCALREEERWCCLEAPTEVSHGGSA